MLRKTEVDLSSTVSGYGSVVEQLRYEMEIEADD